ncbi:MAG TPA: hypothetical protein VGB18_03895 [Candidatus Thermoplasmatota archaeon]
MVPVVDAMGSRESPELVDDVDDIAYHPANPGRDHEYLDITKAWFAYDPMTDNVSFVLELKDTSGLENPAPEFMINCVMTANGTAGGRTEGQFGFYLEKRAHDPEFMTRVAWTPTAGGFEQSTVAHRFNLVFGSEGTLEYVMKRHDLRQRADEVGELTGYCAENYWPARGVLVPASNKDEAASTSMYDVTTLRPAPGVEAPDLSPTTSPAVSTEAEPEGSSPGPEAGLFILAVIAALSAANRLRKVH